MSWSLWKCGQVSGQSCRTSSSAHSCQCQVLHEARFGWGLSEHVPSPCLHPSSQTSITCQRGGMRISVTHNRCPWLAPPQPAVGPVNTHCMHRISHPCGLPPGIHPACNQPLICQLICDLFQTTYQGSLNAVTPFISSSSTNTHGMA